MIFLYSTKSKDYLSVIHLFDFRKQSLTILNYYLGLAIIRTISVNSIDLVYFFALRNYSVKGLFNEIDFPDQMLIL